MKGKALGRGLSALIPGADDGEGLLQIPVADILPNPFQPREELNPETLRELADSIRENGLIQPVAVRKSDDGYQLISGARRLKAAEIAGLRTIPAILIAVQSEAELLELALVENLQREDLNPLEVAQGYRRLMEECGLTQEEVSKKVGKGRPTVANTLRLLRLPDPIKEGLRRETITMGHARAIVSVEDEKKAVELYHRTMKEGLNVRQLEKLISRLNRPAKPFAPPEENPYLRELEDRLRSAYATKVNIIPRGKKGGVIQFSYFSQEELERIVEMMEGEGKIDT